MPSVWTAWELNDTSTLAGVSLAAVALTQGAVPVVNETRRERRLTLERQVDEVLRAALVEIQRSSGLGFT